MYGEDDYWSAIDPDALLDDLLTLTREAAHAAGEPPARFRSADLRGHLLAIMGGEAAFARQGTLGLPPGYTGEAKDKLGRRICFEEGRRVPCAPQPKEGKGTGRAREGAPTVDEAIAHVRRTQSSGVTAESLAALGNRLATMKRDDLREVNRRLGLGASGARTQGELAKRIAERGTKPSAVPAPAPPAPAPPAAAPAPAPPAPAPPSVTGKLDRSLSPAAQGVVRAAARNIAATKALSAGQRVAYFDATQRVVKNMTPAAVEAFAANVTGGVHYGESLEGMAHAAGRHFNEHGFGNAGMGDFLAGQGAAGLFVHEKGTLKPTVFVDGGREGEQAQLARKARRAVLPHQIYAHEFAHGLDGTGYPRSTQQDWRTAWMEELRGGKLTQYAAGSTSEGWAEFGRLVLGGDHDLAQVAREYPKSWAVWQRHGFVEAPPAGFAAPDEEAPAPRLTLPEIFGGRVDLGEAGHADLLLPEEGEAPSGALADFLRALAENDEAPDGTPGPRAVAQARAVLDRLRRGGQAGFAAPAPPAPEDDPWLRPRPEGGYDWLDPESLQWVTGDESVTVPEADEAWELIHGEPPPAAFALPKGFTGRSPEPDAKGRYYCYEQGKRIPCPQEPGHAEARRAARNAARREGRVKALQERLARPPVVSYAAPSVQPTLDEVFGGVATPRAEDLAKLVGAPPGALLDAYGGSGGSVYLTDSHPAVKEFSRFILREPDGSVTVKHSMFFLKKAYRGGGLGLQVFSDAVRQYVAHGIDRVKTTAGKGGIMNGFYTWAVFGYDAPLDAHFRARLPEGLRGATHVQDLMQTPEGRDYWKAKGYQDNMTFDLTPGSRSLATLDAYLARKGQPPVEADAGQVKAIREGRRAEAAKAEAQKEARRKAAGEDTARAKEAALAQAGRGELREKVERAGVSYAEVERLAPARYDSLLTTATRPGTTFPRSDPPYLADLAVRNTFVDMLFARQAARMADPALAPERARWEEQARQHGLDVEAVREMAGRYAARQADAREAIAAAYRDSIRARIEALREGRLR